MPFITQKISCDVVLSFPRTNQSNKLIPFLITNFYIMPQRQSIFPYKFEEKFSHVFSYIFAGDFS